MKIIKRNDIVPISFILEEYIPLKISYPHLAENHPSLEFIKGKKSMLEVTIGKESKCISEITLINCESYKINDATMPLVDAQIGNIQFDVIIHDNVEHIPVETFNIQVFNDGAIIYLSKEPATLFFKNEQVLWATDKNGNIAQLLLFMKSNVVDHLTRELSMQ